MTATPPRPPLARGITLLEASAGTGKTYSITSLVLRLVVEHDLSIDRVLVVTFTEAATAELRHRVRTRLRDALAMFQPGAPAPSDAEVAALLATVDRTEGRVRLERALAGFDEAAISTIHGFCRRVLQENAFESGADFDAELVADANDLLREVVEDFWVREVHDAAPGFVRHLAARGIHVTQLLDLARQVATAHAPDVRPAPRPVDVAGATARWQAAFAAARESWRTQRAAAVQAVVAAAPHLYVRHPLSGPGQLDAAIERLDRLFAADAEPGSSLPRALTAFGQALFVRDTRKTGQPPRHPFFEACDDLAAAAAGLAAALDDQAIALKHALVRDVREVLPRRKQAMHVRSFDDLLGLVREALDGAETGDALVAAVRARYDAALIDEFQDTDPVQWAIFRRLFGGGDRWLYLIGDPKQAIYAFRGADIFTYLDAKTAADRQQELSTNWRSDGRLVRAVNQLFQARPGEPFLYEGIPFHPVAAHHVDDRLHPAGAPLRLRVLTAPDPNPARPTSKGEVEATLPALVAAEVAEFLASGATLTEGERRRRLVPRDVAVLVRKNKQARAVQEALRARGIPAVIQGGESVFATPEALELERVLAALAGPSDARRVKAALATDLLGVGAAGLAALEAEESQWEAWLDRLRAWRRLWADHGFMRLFRALLADLDLPERLLSWSDGERRLTNLLHLAELLHQAAVEERLEPAALVRWLAAQRLQPGADQDTRKLRLETDADAVEIVTIHASKGLEYPVVFCPYLWDGVGNRPPPHLRCHDGSASILDIEIDPKAPERLAHVEAARREEQAENMRLLYVALTRARQACYVYWGLVNEAGTSPLAYLLHRPEADDPVAATAARFKAWKGDDAELVAELEALALASEGCIDVTRVVLGHAAAGRYAPPPASRVQLRASVFDRAPPLDTLWRRASFSQMKHATEGDEAAPPPLDDPRDHDDAPAAALDHDGGAPLTVEPAEGELIPTAALPGGNVLGTAIHLVFEEHDFTDRDPESLRRRLFRALRRHGLDADEWSAPLATAVAAALDTPLDASGLRLRDIPRADRLDELAFDFPVAGAGGAVTRDALVEVVRAHRPACMPPDYVDRLARLRFPALRGFLTGHIDLVFRHDGRWYVVDYKTNFLGDRTGHYAPARLAAEMSAQHYFLQYHLYAVALHRYLRWRLPDYDPARDFGGVFYLFVRGMDPAAGPARGVFFDRPTPERLEALSTLMEPLVN